MYRIRRFKPHWKDVTPPNALYILFHSNHFDVRSFATTIKLIPGTLLEEVVRYYFEVMVLTAALELVY